MGHLGLTPQNATQLGGMRVQATDVAGAERLLEDALALERAGAFAIVLECVPEEVAAVVTERIGIPTIGIGAGRRCDAQVLVVHDLIGISAGFHPRFARAYADVEARIAGAAQSFIRDVESGSFPGEKEVFSLPAEALAELRRRFGKGGTP
jgi:3-methyl-2-oxobutanoate hydroxymethyltransferase